MDETNENYQALRLKPFPNSETNIDILKANLNSLLGETYVISKEYSKKTEWHLHAVFYAPDFDKGAFAPKLYEFLYDNIQDFDKSKKGNSVWTCTPARNLQHAVMYCCKDKDILYGGNQVWKDFVEESKKNSYGKPTSVKELMDDLYSRFENNELNERSLWIEMVFERAQFPDQKTKYHDIDAFIETFKIKKLGKEYVQEMWEKRNTRLD